jgi:hypothetical protein
MPVNPFRKGGPEISVGDGGTDATDAPTARTNLGMGDLDTAAHALINHAGLPGIPASFQTQIWTPVWTNSTTPMSSGALGFTPAFILAFGVSSHMNNGDAAPSFTITQLASTFIGAARSTAFQDAGAVSIQQHNSGEANHECAGFAAGFVGGHAAAGDVTGVAATNNMAVRLDITQFNSSGVQLTPVSGAITARAFVLIVGR